ncbi:Retrovirus-related Pol polyprotein from type-1 retrotransposable element R1 (Fragment) [Anthophora plagiata]
MRSLEHITLKNRVSEQSTKAFPRGSPQPSPFQSLCGGGGLGSGLPAHTQIAQYADDIAISVSRGNLDLARNETERVVSTIQHNLHLLGLELSAPKTEILTFNKTVIHPNTISFKIGDQSVKNQKQARFLGIQLDNKLRFDCHIQHLQVICTKVLNIIKFFRDTWWGCDPQTLLNIYKALIRSRIEYGSFWYFPTHNKKLRNTIEKIQRNAIKLALGLRRSTPSNVVLAEAKIPSIKNRIKYLAGRYSLRVLKKKKRSNPMMDYITEHVEKDGEAKARGQREVKKTIMHDCWQDLKHIMKRTESHYTYPIFEANYDVQFTQVNTNQTIGQLIQNSPTPAHEFIDIIETHYPRHIHIYTDGSKGKDAKATSAACVSLQLNEKNVISLDSSASTFTAEAAGIWMATELANRDPTNSYIIWTDSYGVLQALNNNPNDAHLNIHIVEIKKNILKFQRQNTANKIWICWIPSHTGIPGNEIADQIAKKATKIEPDQRWKIPHEDFYSTLKDKMWRETEEEWKQQATTKGKKYFDYYYRAERKSWFHGKRLPREITSWVGRYRCDHYNIEASLARIGLLDNNTCSCSEEPQDLNHVLWTCPLYTQPRIRMLHKLKEKGFDNVTRIEPFLQKIHTPIIRIVNEFLKAAKLKI